MTGLEPANAGTTNQCLNHLATLAMRKHNNAILRTMARAAQIFPPLPVTNCRIWQVRSLIEKLMEKWQVLLISGSFGLVSIIAGLIFTNPAPAAYEKYLLEEVKRRAQQECSRASENTIGTLVANITCQNLVAAGKPYLQNLLKPMIGDRTTRQDLGIASLYSTQIDIAELNFTGRIETIGILDCFFTYQIP